MKTLINHIGLAAAMTLPLLSGCTEDFGDINTDPSIVTEPDIRFLFTYSADRIPPTGGEWIWESLEQTMRFTQQVTASPYEITNNVNSRYRRYYAEILPNLLEIRKQIDLMEDAGRYRKMKAVTNVLDVYAGIRVTDMNGSIPYSEALQARYENKYDPVFDTQPQLFESWTAKLNEAIGVLSDNSLADQESYGQADIYYQGDWTGWVKLANTLKLRIAVRLERQDNAKAQQLFREVMEDPTGPIDGEGSEMQYLNPAQNPIGNDVDYRSRRFAAREMVRFMKETGDPRIRILFDQNDLTGSYQDTLAKYGANLPDFIDPADPLIMYQGGPPDWTTDPEVAAYLTNPFSVSQYSRYFLISPINRSLLSPKLNGATGNTLQVLVSYAETCFYIAEFIEKGYDNGINTGGSASDWYNKGIASSIRSLNAIALEAQSETAFSGSGDAEIAQYLDDPGVKLDGANDLERIYTQQYLAFFLLPNEAYVFCRRTGYPRNNSSYYRMEPFNEPIPRRFWINDPGEVNRANWEQAYQEQGFTLRAVDAQTLSQERVWYDKTAPAFGEGD